MSSSAWAAPGGKDFARQMQDQEKSLRRPSLLLSLGFSAAGLSAYVLMAVSKRHMSPLDFSYFSVFWSFGFFLTGSVGGPIEQEITRCVAHNDASGRGFDPAVREAVGYAAALGGGAMCVALVVGSRGVLEGLELGPIAVLAFALLIAGEAMTAIVRGILAGTRSTLALAGLVAGQGLLRMGLVLGVVAAGANVRLAALAVAVSSFTWVFLIWTTSKLRTRHPLEPPSAGLSRRGIVRLVSASPFCALFSVGTPALASLVASPAERLAVGDVAAALALTSSPVFLAAALQSVLLPAMVRSLLEGGPEALHRTTRAIISVVVGLGALAAGAAAIAGPTLLGVLFGPTPGVGRVSLATMTFAAGLLFLSNLLAPVCIARRSHGSVTRAWVSGAIAMGCLLIVPGPLGSRVAIALLGGTCVVAGSLIMSLSSVWHRTSSMER